MKLTSFVLSKERCFMKSKTNYDIKYIGMKINSCFSAIKYWQLTLIPVFELLSPFCQRLSNFKIYEAFDSTDNNSSSRTFREKNIDELPHCNKRDYIDRTFSIARHFSNRKRYSYLRIISPFHSVSFKRSWSRRLRRAVG